MAEDLEDIPPIPNVGAKQALDSIAALAGAKIEDLKSVNPPELTFFRDDDSWHLAYFFRSVPAAPQQFLKDAQDRKSAGP